MMCLTALLTPVLCECKSSGASGCNFWCLLDSYCNGTSFESDYILVFPRKLFSLVCYFRSIPLSHIKASASMALEYPLLEDKIVPCKAKKLPVVLY